MRSGPWDEWCWTSPPSPRARSSGSSPGRDHPDSEWFGRGARSQVGRERAPSTIPSRGALARAPALLALAGTLLVTLGGTLVLTRVLVGRAGLGRVRLSAGIGQRDGRSGQGKGGHDGGYADCDSLVHADA